MREAIGGTWLFQIVIAFVLLFTGFMCLTINHTKAFNVKNTIINTIERAGGVDLSDTQNDPAIKAIVKYLNDVSYRTTGKCSDGYTGIGRDGNKNSSSPAFCILEQKARENTVGSTDFDSISSYYRVEVFYQLDLPIFNSIFNFSLRSDTKIMNTFFKGKGVYNVYGNICREKNEDGSLGPEKSCADFKDKNIINLKPNGK